MQQPPVQQIAGRISAAIAEKLGVKSSGLRGQLRRVGHRMPASVRRDIRAVLDALPLADNPRLMVQIDLPRLEAAEKRVLAWLKTVNPGERRKDLILAIAGGVALSLIVVFGLYVAVLSWRGLI